MCAEKSKVKHLKDSSYFPSFFFYSLSWLSYRAAWNVSRRQKRFKSHKSGPSGAAAVTQAVVTWPPGLQHKFNTCGELLPHTAMCAGTLAQHTVLKKKTLGLFLMTLLFAQERKKTLQGLCVLFRRREKEDTRRIPVVPCQPHCVPPTPLDTVSTVQLVTV